MMLATIAMAVSSSTIHPAAFTMDWSLARYDPYVIIAPMPSESVKNACPSASRTLLGSSSAKFGLNRKLRASPDPSIPSALTSSSKRIPKRIGKKIRATRSIPFWIPKYTTPTVAILKLSERPNCRPILLTCCPKTSPIAPAAVKPPRLHWTDFQK